MISNVELTSRAFDGLVERGVDGHTFTGRVRFVAPQFR